MTYSAKVCHAALEEIILIWTLSSACLEMVNTPEQLPRNPLCNYGHIDAYAKTLLSPPCCRLIVALVSVAKRCLHMLHTLIRPPNQISFTAAHRNPPRALPRSTYLIRQILCRSTAALLIGCLLLPTQHVFCLLPVCYVAWLCSCVAELISFSDSSVCVCACACVRVRVRLSQMNYASLPYVISFQPDNTGAIW